MAKAFLIVVTEVEVTDDFVSTSGGLGLHGILHPASGVADVIRAAEVAGKPGAYRYSFTPPVDRYEDVERCVSVVMRRREIAGA